MQNQNYDPQAIEKKWQSHWEVGNKFLPKESEKKFSIVIPPPNVTGSLHMGHALNNSIQDLLVRFHRMNIRTQFSRSPFCNIVLTIRFRIMSLVL